MSAYDDWRCIDTQADKDAAHDAKLEAARQHVELTGYELGESLCGLVDEQFHQFCAAVVATTDPALQHLVRMICSYDVERKAPTTKQKPIGLYGAKRAGDKKLYDAIEAKLMAVYRKV